MNTQHNNAGSTTHSNGRLSNRAAARPNHRRRMGVVALAAAAAALLLSACSGTDAPPSLAGVWQADDGSGLKTIREDGTCTGMYYANGQPLDIGGVTTCQLSSQPSDDGTYTLVVEQPPNRASYPVTFEGEDRLTMHVAGARVGMERR